jgi:hypothetical protein
MAQLAYNNKKLESTGQTPYYANYGTHLHLFERTFLGPKLAAALATADKMKKIHEILQTLLEKAQRQSISYVNKKRKMAP